MKSVYERNFFGCFFFVLFISHPLPTCDLCDKPWCSPPATKFVGRKLYGFVNGSPGNGCFNAFQCIWHVFIYNKAVKTFRTKIFSFSRETSESSSEQRTTGDDGFPVRECHDQPELSTTYLYAIITIIYICTYQTEHFQFGARSVVYFLFAFFFFLFALSLIRCWGSIPRREIPKRRILYEIP